MWMEEREKEHWEDEEVWEKYNDLYEFWDLRTGVVDYDDEYDWEDHDWEFFEDEQEEQEDFLPDWQDSEGNVFDEDWDEERQAVFFAEKAEDTGCDDELQCEFHECEEDEEADFESHCWREECNSECGQYTCGLWHFDLETEIWTLEECVEEFDLQENLSENAEAAVKVFRAYDGTVEKAFELFCGTEDCLGDLANQVPAPELDLDLSVVQAPLQNPEINNLIGTFLDDLGQ